MIISSVPRNFLFCNFESLIRFLSYVVVFFYSFLIEINLGIKLGNLVINSSYL